ncbi:MAG: YceI family protein [Cyclonatronaceae bacterium]
MQSIKFFPHSFIAVLFLWVLSSPIAAQTYTVDDEASTLTVYGTANIRDWDAKAGTILGEISIRKEEDAAWIDAQPSWFERVNLKIPVEDLDSDSGRMNNNMHKYLKIDDHPEITYRMTEARELAVHDNPGIVLTVQGVVTAAGVEHEITHDVQIRENNSGGLVVSGSHDLNMTDFGIDPPTALLGSIRARDEMTIKFELHLR